MGRLSEFHTKISTNYKELYDDFMNSTNADFCKKHKIGWRTLNYYFGGLKKPLYNSNQIWREDVKDTLENIRTWNYHYNLY